VFAWNAWPFVSLSSTSPNMDQCFNLYFWFSWEKIAHYAVFTTSQALICFNL